MQDIFIPINNCLSLLNSSQRRHALADEAVEITSYLNTSSITVSGTLFLTGGVFEWDIAHRRSVALLCIYAVLDHV